MLQHLLFLRPSIEGVSVTTENVIFKLVYAVSCPLFLAFGVIFYTRICFTDPINCIANSTESFKVLKAMDSYCLENSYIVPQYNAEHDGSTTISFEEDVARIYLRNYQYVGIFFVICGALCYLPYVLWEWFENGLLKGLIENIMSIKLHEEEVVKEVRKLKDIWKGNRKMLDTYASANVLCEIVNVLCICSLFFLANEFLDGNFMTLGASALKMTPLFPKLANCSFQAIGNSGALNFDGVCTMNMNYLSEKMFYAAWWWLTMVVSLSTVNLTYRYALLRSVDLRVWVITDGHLHTIGKVSQFKSESQGAEESDNDLVAHVPYLKQVSYGEFFMLKRIQANVPPATFKIILDRFEFYFKLSKKE